MWEAKSYDQVTASRLGEFPKRLQVDLTKKGQPTIGIRLGPYEIVEQVGKGAVL
jgi:hypothetical protein